MKIITELSAWQAFRKTIAPHLSIGFVPTMGNLHPGHLSLCTRSLAENNLTVVSIFINPTQFNHPDDFKYYPKTQEADLASLKALGVAVCLLPTETALYPDAYRYQLTETETTLTLEGKHRPGHFTGVLTIVMKLLQWVRPTNVYMGEKDYQQYTLIRDMVSAFFMEMNIIACPTVREPSGLAYSSRNQRLSVPERQLAETFARCFRQAKPLEDIQRDLIQAGIHIDYLEMKDNRRYAAVQIGAVRLIDNYTLEDLTCDP